MIVSRLLSLNKYIFLIRDQLKHSFGFRIFSLCWRPVIDRQLFLPSGQVLVLLTRSPFSFSILLDYLLHSVVLILIKLRRKTGHIFFPENLNDLVFNLFFTNCSDLHQILGFKFCKEYFNYINFALCIFIMFFDLRKYI